MRSVYDPILVPQGWPLVPPLRGVDAWWDERFLPDLPPSGPAPFAAGTFKVDGSSTATFTLPAYGGTDGIVVIKAARSSNGSTLTSISDNSGSGNAYTERTPAGGEIANSSSRHNVWTVPFTSAMGGATVTVVYSGSNNTAGAYQVWPGYAFDNFVTNGGGGTGSTETTPALTAVTGTPIAIGMGGGRGNADGTQYTLNTGSLPSGWESAVATSSTQGATNRNAHGWMAYDGDPGSSSISSAVFSLTGSVNSRWTATMTLAPVGGSITEPANPADETDAAVALGRLKARASTAVTETGAAQAVGRRKTKALATVTEADASQALSRRKTRPVAVTTEADATVAPGRRKTRLVGVVAESDSAIAITAGSGPDVLAVGTVSETDAAQLIVRLKRKAIATVTEADSSIAVSRRKRRAVGITADTGTLVAMARLHRKALALVSETDVPQVLGRRKTLALLSTVESQSALPITAPVSMVRGTITYVTSVETLFTTAVSSYAVAAPGTLTAGDYIWVELSVNNTALGTFTVPDGSWTQHGAWFQSGSNVKALFGHFVTSGEAASPPASWTFGYSASCTATAHLGVFNGVDTGSPLDVAIGQVQNTSASPRVVPSITTITQNAYIIGGSMVQSATSRTVSAPAGWTEVQNSSGENAGRGANFAWKGTQPVPGATGTASFTYSGTALGGIAYQAALRPKLVPGSGGGTPSTVGTTVETDTSRPLTRVKRKALTTVSEADSAVTITKAGGASNECGLIYPRPNTTGYTIVTLPLAGGTVNLSASVDYVLKQPLKGDSTYNAITGQLAIRGGRNIVWIGGLIGGRKTPPSGTGYDTANRGIRIGGYNAGDDGADTKTLYFEGILFESGTHLSDAIQVCNFEGQNHTYYFQNIRVDAINYGWEAGVHSDCFQILGGPKNLFIHRWTAKHCTYQGFYMDPNDDTFNADVPRGAGHVPWEISYVNLEDDDLTGGARYMWAERERAWSQIMAEEVWVTATARNPYDSFGQAQSPGVRIGVPPGGDFVPLSLWSTGVYNCSSTPAPTGGLIQYVEETDAAQAVGKRKRKAIGTAVETDDNGHVNKTIKRTINPVSETGSALSLARRQERMLGTAEETDEAVGVGGAERLVTLADPLDMIDFPGARAWHVSSRWPRSRPPSTRKGLLLYRDGRVVEVSSAPPVVVLEGADDYIVGGTLWTTMNTSWQAQVLVAAGYELVTVTE